MKICKDCIFYLDGGYCEHDSNLKEHVFKDGTWEMRAMSIKEINNVCENYTEKEYQWILS